MCESVRVRHACHGEVEPIGSCIRAYFQTTRKPIYDACFHFSFQNNHHRRRRRQPRKQKPPRRLLLLLQRRCMHALRTRTCAYVSVSECMCACVYYIISCVSVCARVLICRTRDVQVYMHPHSACLHKHTLAQTCKAQRMNACIHTNAHTGRRGGGTESC